MVSMATINPKHFVSLADGDLTIWKALIGCQITHISLGDGEITQIDGREGDLRIVIRFRTSRESRFLQSSFSDGKITRLALSEAARSAIEMAKVLRERRRLEQQRKDEEEARRRQADQAKRERQQKMTEEIRIDEQRSRRQSEMANVFGKLPLPFKGIPVEVHGPLIFHFTHIRNLPSILEEGCIASDARSESQELCKESIGDPRIKYGRRNKLLPIAPGGFVGNYVPFYFAPRSPMLYRLFKQNIGTPRDEMYLIYLISTVGTVCLNTDKWVIADGNAFDHETLFFNDLNQLDQVDWEVIGQEYWSDNSETKRSRQAEFLVHDSFPWEWVRDIGVMDYRIMKEVNDLIGSQNHKPRVLHKPEWYF